ncbi:MAG TPA: HEAT repeat domain-containing protein [Chthoniobacteraceae bacterium]|jgi:quinoprotein glucose dehydrogenase
MSSLTAHFRRALSVGFVAAALSSPTVSAAEIGSAEGRTGVLKGPERVPIPKLRAASDEGTKALLKFRLLPGFEVDLWAAEPLLANPVAFTLDEQGRAYVAETYRYRTSTLDIRHYMFLLEDELASRTTEDWAAYVKKSFPTDWQKLEIETEVVRRVEDKDGDGKADASSEFAAGMNTMLDGINSGVLAQDGKVWVTNMPNLWLFSGMTPDGKAAKRESLSFGYGVRFNFTGHDLHGLAMGPDGRLYFSFGDRGASVKTKEGNLLAFPDEGAVFRCEPDGSHLEVVHRGLRNPQELAFDNQGNLFTGDNDSDQGDRERWVYVVEGGDSGWRVGWQHSLLGKDQNPWLAEGMWKPRGPQTPLYILSPIVNLADGPSGLAHYPGTGLPPEFEDNFLVCSFVGSSARGQISMLRVQESGASFSVLKQPATFLGGTQSTDVEFGPDSKIYFSEWGEGWEGTGRGRIYRTWNTAAHQTQAAQIAEVKKLLAEGFPQREVGELGKLLAHPDQRIRLRAQWALAAKADGAPVLLEAALKNSDPLARLHGIWGIGHIARLAGYRDKNASAEILKPILPLLTDADAQVRAQTIRVLGENGATGSTVLLFKALTDQSPRVRYFAAQALAKLRQPGTAAPIFAMLRENDDKDEYLRHAGVMALAHVGNVPALTAAALGSSRSGRLAALLALRRLERPEVALFLGDDDPLLVKEAARAINDVPIAEAFPALGETLGRANTDEQFTLRAINANFRIGTPAAAQALAAFAADPQVSELLRLEAITALTAWPKPFARDRVVGLYRPLDARAAQPAMTALQGVLPKLVEDRSIRVAMLAIDAVSALGMKDQTALLSALIAKPAVAAKVRGRALAALAALTELNDPKLSEAIKVAIIDRDPALRIEAVALLAKLDPERAAVQLTEVFGSSGVAEKKIVVTALGEIKAAAADQALAGLLDQLIAGKIPAEVQLEVLDAASKRTAPVVKEKLKSYESNLPKNDTLAAFVPVLAGGDPIIGEKLFKEHAIAQCLRCHKVNGTGGDAGPDLTGIAAKKDRRYLIESIVHPGAQIAEGFQSLLVTLNNGDMQIGIVKSETPADLTLQTPVPDAPLVTVKKADIKSRENAPSGMPAGFGEVLTRRELRDILEYVAKLK